MYGADPDPYCYPGTDVLINKPGIRDAAVLAIFEAEAVRARASLPLPAGRLSARHYKAIHRHLFGDVYAWAGEVRTVRIAKDGSRFCHPEYIERELNRLFRQLRERAFLRAVERGAFARGAAHLLAELNAIHAFRDGNGRAQLVFLFEVARRAGHPIDFSRLDPQVFLAAMVASFQGDERLLTAQILCLIA